MSAFSLITAVLCIHILILGVDASPNGAPVAACVDMTPQHGAAPQAGAPVYALTAARTGAETFTVTLAMTQGAPFKGFLIQARAQGSTVPRGVFEEALPANTQFRRCTNDADSVTHANNNTKTSLTFNWRSPGGSLTGTRFVATTCLDKITFWLGIESADLGGVSNVHV